MKLTISKSKSSKTYYVSESYRNEQGKSTTRTVGKLGSYEELRGRLGPDVDIDEWARFEVRRMTEEKNAAKPKVVHVKLRPNVPYANGERRNINVGYLFLQRELYDLGFKKLAAAIVEKHSLKYDFEKALADLIFSEALDPESGGSALEYCKDSLFEMPDYEAEDLRDAIGVIAMEGELIVGAFLENGKKADTKIPIAGRRKMTPSAIIEKTREDSFLAKYCGRLKREYQPRRDKLDEEIGFKAHGVVSFVTQLILNQLSSKVGASLNKAIKTEKLAETLREMNIMPLGDAGYMGTFNRTALTDALHQFIDVGFDSMYIAAEMVEKTVKESKAKHVSSYTK